MSTQRAMPREESWRSVVGILTRKCFDEDVEVFEIKGVLTTSKHKRYLIFCKRYFFRFVVYFDFVTDTLL